MNALTPLLYAMTHTNSTVLCVASRHQSIRIWQHEMLRSIEVIGECSLVRSRTRDAIVLCNGSRISFISGTADRLRGYSPNCIALQDYPDAPLDKEMLALINHHHRLGATCIYIERREL